MYRPQLKTRDRTGALAGVIAIHALLGFALLNLSGRITVVEDGLTAVTDLIAIAPEPEPPVVEIQPLEAAPEEEGEASPPNIRSEASPVVAPKPEIALPVPPPVVASPTPAEGPDPTQGAAEVPGPGTGAGGTGTGTGAGGSGSGTGGGGLAAVRTRLATPPLRGRDFPRSMLDEWPRGARIFMRFRVGADGQILQCIVDRGTGDPSFDSRVCAIAQARMRYRPALDREGRRVADWAAYGQEPPR